MGAAALISGTVEDSPIRLVNSIDPVKLDADPQDLSCGMNAQKAAMVVDANPGSTLTVSWSGVTQNVRTSQRFRASPS